MAIDLASLTKNLVTAAINPQRQEIATLPEEMDDDRVTEILGEQPSPLLRESLLTVDGPLQRVEVPNPRWPTTTDVFFHRPKLPALAPDCLAEARERIEALRFLLRPAPEALVRKWVYLVATNMDSQEAAEEKLSRARLMVAKLDLPAICFTPDSEELVYREQRKASGTWFPSYVRLRDILSTITAPFTKELARLLKLLERLEDGTPPAGPLALPAPSGDGPIRADGEIIAWVKARIMEPADAMRALQVRGFLTRLKQNSPEQHEKWAAPITNALIPVEGEATPKAQAEAQRWIEGLARMIGIDAAPLLAAYRAGRATVSKAAGPKPKFPDVTLKGEALKQFRSREEGDRSRAALVARAEEMRSAEMEG